MKKLTKMLALILFCGFAILSAQPYNVTFQVDMNVKMVMGEFDSLLQEVRMTGTLTDPQWDPPTAPVLTDDDGDGIFETTLSLNAGSYEYKYLIGNAWGNDETLSGNRAITVSAEEVLDPVFYSDKAAPEFPTVGAGKIALRLNVNMTRQRQIGAFNPSTNVVRTAGSFQGWSPGDAPDMEDTDGNIVYTVVYEVDPSTTYEYKHLIGTDWGNDETDNRSIAVGVNDTALAPVYFNDIPYDPNFAADSFDVTFQINMAVRTLEGLFDPSSDNVVVAGSFNGWNGSNDTYFTKGTSDTIYTGTWRIPGNQDIEYKFVINGSTWESISNRSASIGAENITLPLVYFNNDSVVSQIKDGNIEFIVKMDVLEELGIFDNEVDSLQVRGEFNGWSDSEADKSLLNQDALDPNYWFLTVPFVQTPSDEGKLFKYFVKVNNPIKSSWKDGYERPSFHGGGNRTVSLDDGTAEHYFDDIHPDWVIEADDYLDVVFSVDMRPAMDPNVQGADLVFDPSTGDTLWYICEQPTWAAVMDWDDSDEMKYLFFTDEDDDSIYTATLTVNSAALSRATFNSFMYRYAFYDQSAGSWISEPSGFSNFAYRIRYIGQDAARSFPVNPWPMPVDTWTNKEIKTDIETDPFQSYLDYLETDINNDPTGLANQFVLNQNYPNPFNPSTTISFKIPVAGKVKLVVYNVLGQKIKTLLNHDINAGKHAYKWNGLNDSGIRVPSGIYFYRIDAENFTAIKKMVLIK